MQLLARNKLLNTEHYYDSVTYLLYHRMLVPIDNVKVCAFVFSNVKVMGSGDASRYLI